MDWIDILCDIVTNCALIYIFLKLSTPRFSQKLAYCVAAALLLVLLTIYIGMQFLFPHLPKSMLSLCILTIPSFLLCALMSRYGGWRFIFVYCSVDIIGFVINLLAWMLVPMLGLHEVWVLFLVILFFIPYIYQINCLSGVFRKMEAHMKQGWGFLAFLSMAFYAYLYFLLLYPEPMEKRQEYIPVVCGFSLVILLAYVVVIKMLKNMNEMWDLEQNRLQMQLELEVRERKLVQAQTKQMINQIKPHFIYNTLSAIRFLIKTEPDNAAMLIYDFSKYLRANISSIDQDKLIRFSEELEHIEAYTRIEKLRFKERLQLIYEIEETDFFLPPLCVEPLVENAIKHGICNKEEGGTVWVRSFMENGGYVAEVEDTGTGFLEEEAWDHVSVGLSYVRFRIGLIKDATCSVYSAAGKGARIRLWFPPLDESAESERRGAGI